MNRYTPTQLEKWVDDFYLLHGITCSNQLNIDELTARANIWVYYLPQGSKTIERNDMHSICIDSRLSRVKQWEDFLHELCHILRHSGNQVRMPSAFLDMQESEARSFQLYAAIPYSMLPAELPQNTWEALKYFVEQFGVSYELAVARLEQIQRRILQNEVDRIFNAAIRPKRIQPDYSPETRKILAQLHRQISRKKGQHFG